MLTDVPAGAACGDFGAGVPFSTISHGPAAEGGAFSDVPQPATIRTTPASRAVDLRIDGVRITETVVHRGRPTPAVTWIACPIPRRTDRRPGRSPSNPVSTGSAILMDASSTSEKPRACA